MNSQSSILSPIRRHDIDWLRVGVTFFLILLQAVSISRAGTGKPAGPGELWFDVRSLLFLVSQWYIPLAFLISGWSRKVFMQHRSGKGAIRERFLRLGVPFLTGVLVICPLTRYVELGGRAAPPGGKAPQGVSGFTAFLLDFFTSRDVFTWYHLWFLFYLFVFSVISWPFFSWLLGRKVTPMKTGRAWVYLPIVPLAMIQLVGDSFRQPGSYEGWAGPASFLTYFILGFVISRYSAYERVMNQEAKRAGVLGLALLAALMPFSARLPVEVFRMITAAGSWLVVVGILGLSRKYLERPSGVLTYLRKATLPVYLLHHAPLVIFGASLAAYPVNDGLKLLVLMGLTLGTVLPFYHVLIRRIALLRLLFGMKREHRHTESWKEQAMHRDRDRG